MRNAKPTLTFPSEAALTKWLADTDAGQTITTRLFQEQLDYAIRKDKRHVLIVLDSETLDVYASSKGVAVLVQTLLQGDDSDRTARESYLSSTLPLGWRRMFRLKNLVQTASYRQVSPETELLAVLRRAEFATLKEVFGFPPPKEKKP
jgi:hypothetical protein